jgi:hypothetical protein
MKEKIVSWFKRFGLVGFLFFTLKGLLWLLLAWLGLSIF